MILGKDCCTVMNEQGSSCSCGYMSSPAPTFVEKAAHLVSQAFVNLEQSGQPTKSGFACNQVKASDYQYQLFLVILKF